MNRDEYYFNPPDSYSRERPAWTRETDKHVAAFLEKGGAIYQAAPGESWYAQHYKSGNKHAFVINPTKGVKK